jgi:hypothetical protein
VTQFAIDFEATDSEATGLAIDSIETELATILRPVMRRVL